MPVNNANFFNYKDKYIYSNKKLNEIKSSGFEILPKNDNLTKISSDISNVLFSPWRSCLQNLGHTIEPLPGACKDKYLLGLVKKVTSAFNFIILFPIGFLSASIAIPFHCYAHSHRPTISYICNEKKQEIVNPDPQTLTVRSHNLGFVYESMRIVGDLRDVKTRAAEIGKWIKEGKNLPEVIFFQEAFHIDGTKILCEQLKEKYPYIIHNIAPHILGLNNGAIIASKYPIEEFTYHPLNNMLGPEKWSTRGLLKIRIQKSNKTIDVYGTHLQALLGKERAEVRAKQMGQIQKWIKEDQTKKPADVVLLLGDMNASKITAWGEKNTEDDKMFKKMQTTFTDIFSNDHDEYGKRITGNSKFTKKDTPDGINELLPEPTGSWYIGPFANKGLIMNIKEWYERFFNHVPNKTKIKEIPKNHCWGTKSWSKLQHACSARFDFILRYNKGNKNIGTNDRAEIRRVKVDKNVQSAPSDHLPIDGIIYI